MFSGETTGSSIFRRCGDLSLHVLVEVLQFGFGNSAFRQFATRQPA
jgi:hypothetical protein